VTSESSHLADRPWYFALLLGAPLGVVLLRALGSLFASARRKMSERSASPASAAKRALDDARAAQRRGDAAQVASAIERALYGMVEARLGLKARAVLRGDLVRTLEERGAPNATAEGVAKVLDACDGLRFAGATADAAKLVEDAANLVGALGKLTQRGETP
jgi:hypothetical protein